MKKKFHGKYQIRAKIIINNSIKKQVQHFKYFGVILIFIKSSEII